VINFVSDYKTGGHDIMYFRGDNYGFIQSPECILTEHKMAQGWRKTLGFMDANLKYE
jgi:hypothetical protein